MNQAPEIASLKKVLERLEAQHREMETHILRIETMCADSLTAMNVLIDLLSNQLWGDATATRCDRDDAVSDGD